MVNGVHVSSQSDRWLTGTERVLFQVRKPEARLGSGCLGGKSSANRPKNIGTSTVFLKGFLSSADVAGAETRDAALRKANGSARRSCVCAEMYTQGVRGIISDQHDPGVMLCVLQDGRFSPTLPLLSADLQQVSAAIQIAILLAGVQEQTSIFSNSRIEYFVGNRKWSSRCEFRHFGKSGMVPRALVAIS